MQLGNHPIEDFHADGQRANHRIADHVVEQVRHTLGRLHRCPAIGRHGSGQIAALVQRPEQCPQIDRMGLAQLRNKGMERTKADADPVQGAAVILFQIADQVLDLVARLAAETLEDLKGNATGGTGCLNLLTGEQWAEDFLDMGTDELFQPLLDLVALAAIEQLGRQYLDLRSQGVLTGCQSGDRGLAPCDIAIGSEVEHAVHIVAAGLNPALYLVNQCLAGSGLDRWCVANCGFAVFYKPEAFQLADKFTFHKNLTVLSYCPCKGRA